MMIARIQAAIEIDGIQYAADQVVAFDDAQASALEAAGAVELLIEAPVFVEHDANCANRGLS